MAGIIELLNFSTVSSVTGIPVFVLWILVVVLYYILGFIYLVLLMMVDYAYDSDWSFWIVTFWPIDLSKRIMTLIIMVMEQELLHK